MSWGIVAGAVVGGVVSYAGQKSSNAANAKAQKQQGYVDTTTTRAPDSYSTPYRQGALDSAWGALTGQTPLSGGAAAPIQGNPNAAAAKPAARTTGGGGAGAGATYGGYTAAQLQANPSLVSKLGSSAAAKWSASGGGAGGGAGAGAPAGPAAPSTVAGKTGQSGSTSSIINRLEGLPGQNAAMNNTAEQYSTNLLNGKSSNPLLSPAAIAAANVGNDPRLSAFQDYLMGNLGVGGASGGGAAAQAVPYGQSVGPGQAGYAQAAAAYGASNGGGYGGGSATGTDAALRDLVAGKAPAGWAGMDQGISDDVNSGRADIIRQLKAAGVGSGSYGSDSYDQQIGSAVAQGDRQLANQLATARYGAFQNALGLGTQYDIGMADVAAKNYATSSGASSASAALAAQQRGQDLGALGNALSLGEEGRYGTAGQLGNLASLFSGDQKAALGGINDLAASRRGDLSAAGQLSLGSDQAQNNLRSSGMAANASRANVNSQIAWQQQQFYDPLSRLGQFNDILNGDFGPYGSETTQGRDTRSGGGAAAVSPFGAALGGAAIGGQLGGLYNQQQQQQPVYNSPTGPAAGVYG